MNEEQIFTEAIQMEPTERSECLDKMCGDNEDLRRRVEKLIGAHENPDSFLNPPDPGPPPTEDYPRGAESAGTIIGKYKLLQEIGEGGMGTVFMAEQTHPVRRRVAVYTRIGSDRNTYLLRIQEEAVDAFLASGKIKDCVRVDEAYQDVGLSGDTWTARP